MWQLVVMSIFGVDFLFYDNISLYFFCSLLLIVFLLINKLYLINHKGKSVMLGLYYSITAIILIVTLAILLIGKYKKLNINHGTMVLVFCCFLIAAFFFRYMWADTAIQNTVA